MHGKASICTFHAARKASELARPLQVLEAILLFADVCLFAVIFLSAVAVFAAETIGAAKRRIRSAFLQRRNARAGSERPWAR
jgi:hypothetical protein